MKNIYKIYAISLMTLMLLLIYPSQVFGAKDKSKPVISAVSVSPSITNKTNQNITVKFKVSEKAKVTLKVYKGSTLVKTGLNGAIKSGNISWGWAGTKNNGKYTIKLNAVDFAGNKAKTKTTIVNIDTVKPVISYLGVDDYSLNNTKENIFDPVDEPLYVYYDLSEDAKVTVKAFGGSNPSGYVIYSSNQKVEEYGNDFKWNGNFGSTTIPDGEYRLEVSATDKAGNVSVTKSITVIKDTTAPVLTSGKFENDVFNLGIDNTFNYQANEPVIALLTITNSKQKMVYINLVGSYLENVLTLINNVNLDNPDVLKNDFEKFIDQLPIPAEPSFVTDGSIKWNGQDMLGNMVAEGDYSYKLVLIDRVGKVQATNGSVKVCDGFAPMIYTQSIDTPFSPDGTNQVAIKYTLSKTATSTIKIYRDNVFIKEFNNILGIQGENTLNWDGKNYDGNVASPGTYTFKINATDIANNSAVESSGTLIIQ